MLYRVLNVFIIIIITINIISCAKEEVEQPDEIILAKIGDKTISKSEFIRRAEYTVRPPYCRSSLGAHKMIVLNSLIAEKLFSIEAGDTNKFITHPRIQNSLLGRKEQAMRQWQYHVKASSKVELDTAAIATTLKWSERKYNITYLNIPDSTVASLAYQQLSQNPDRFDEILTEEYGLEEIPQREVQWHDSEHDAILDALFSGPLNRDQILPPVETNDGEYLIVKINGWIRTPNVTQSQVEQKWKNISDRYKKRVAQGYYKEYIQEVMEGKSIDFNPETFFQLADILGPVYLKTDAEKKDELKELYWDLEAQEERKDTKDQLEQIRNDILFSINDEPWTVNDLFEEIQRHPLVFRKLRMKNAEFGQQLQFAIIDLVRDKYLTEEAYAEGYDEVNVVQRNASMWEDSFNSLYHKEQILKKRGVDEDFTENYLQIIKKNLNPYIDSLQTRYSDQIKINTEVFNEIQLTRIDLVATYKNEPYPVVVPGFPQLTTDSRLDYGKKMETSQDD